MLFVVVLAVASILVVGLNLYLYRTVKRVYALGPRARRALGTLMTAGFFAMILARMLRRLGWSAALGSVAPLEAFTWTMEIGVVLSAALLLPLDLVTRLGRRLSHATGRPPLARAAAPAADAPTSLAAPRTPVTDPPHASSPSAGLPRRAFLERMGAAAALSIGGGTSIYGTLFGRHDYVVQDAVIALPRLAPAYHGYTIVQISDIHFGTFVGERELEAAVDRVRSARPDLIAITGDLVDHDLAYLGLLGRLSRRLQGIARDGVFAIPGNHDHYAGVDQVLAAVASGGSTVLRNAGRVIGSASAGFNLLGVDDVWVWNRYPGAGPDLDRALAQTDPDLPRVLLCHNPSYFVDCFESIDLQLSGHTHGGQVQLGLNPAELVLPYGYVAGRYTHGDAQLYVNRGFGTAGPPTRVLSPPEITRVILTGA